MSWAVRVAVPLKTRCSIRCETPPRAGEDRKSTRLNSSHSQTSYAVFCLKKKIRYQRREVKWAISLYSFAIQHALNNKHQLICHGRVVLVIAALLLPLPPPSLSPRAELND